MFEIELTICIDIDLVLNNLQRLICHKTQPTNLTYVICQYVINKNILDFWSKREIGRQLGVSHSLLWMPTKLFNLGVSKLPYSLGWWLATFSFAQTYTMLVIYSLWWSNLLWPLNTLWPPVQELSPYWLKNLHLNF